MTKTPKAADQQRIIMDDFTFSENLENGGRTIEHEITVDMAQGAGNYR